MFLSIMFILGLAHAGPFKIGIVSEPGAESRANEFISKLSQLEPFRQLIAQNALEISASPTTVTGLNCRGGRSGIARLASCNTSPAASVCRGMDFCPIFTAVPNIGAGDNVSPISSSTFPWTTMLHEMVHSFGFSDNYAYTQLESNIYCNGVWANGPNSQTDSKPNTYKSAEAARKDCLRRIPWCQDAIDAGTEVVQRKPDGKYMIGSPTPSNGCPDSSLGVYLGSNCQIKNPDSTWRPYFCPSVMGYPSLGEATCGVTRRHRIIAHSPNLLPAYYQQSIFNIIVERKNLRGLTFKPSPSQSAPANFRYGLPEIDNLSHSDSSPQNICQEGEIETETAKDIMNSVEVIAPQVLVPHCIN